MNRYTVVIEEKAERQLRAVRDKKLLCHLTDRILALGSNPRPSAVKKMVGQKDKWRIRVGDWRVVYVIEDGRLVVLVVAVGGRAARFTGRCRPGIVAHPGGWLAGGKLCLTRCRRRTRCC